jgi:UDP-glucose-4-epimerase GalE
MDRVLVTGGAGYIGSHACKALARAGYLPVAYDNLSQGHRELVRWGPLVVGDLGDGRALDDAFRRYRPVAVMHFAARADVGESVRDPALYYRTNVAGTVTLLETMRAHAVLRIVHSSTCATYGLPRVLPITEDMPQRPVNPYGRSKLMVEGMLRDFEAAYGLGWTALRYFNACGADPEGEAGEMHDPEGHLIPRALMAAAGELPHLDLFGDDYPTPDGTCIRDYVHVADLAEMHVRALERVLAGRPSVALNLGTGKGHSVSEVVAAVERVTGLSVPLRVVPRRPGDPPVLVADPALARSMLGCAARYQDLDEIVATAWRWYVARRSAAFLPGIERKSPQMEPRA